MFHRIIFFFLSVSFHFFVVDFDGFHSLRIEEFSIKNVEVTKLNSNHKSSYFFFSIQKDSRTVCAKVSSRTRTPPPRKSLQKVIQNNPLSLERVPYRVASWRKKTSPAGVREGKEIKKRRRGKKRRKSTPRLVLAHGSCK